MHPSTRQERLLIKKKKFEEKEKRRADRTRRRATDRLRDQETQDEVKRYKNNNLVVE